MPAVRRVVLLLALAACGRAEPAPPSEPVAPVAPATREAAAPLDGPSVLTPIVETDRSSSALALATVRGADARATARVAVVADEDDSTLRLLTLPEGAEIASARLEGTPGHVVVDRRGVVWVAIRDGDAVASFSLSCDHELAGCRLSAGARLATAREPIALALADDGGALFVVSTWGRELARYALPGGERLAGTPLARDPRALLLTRQGDALVIAHASGSVLTTATIAASAPAHAPPATREARLDYRDRIYAEGSPVPLADEPRFAAQGFSLARAGAFVLAPMAVVYPGDPEPTPSYGSVADGYFPHESVIVSLGGGPGQDVPRLRVRATVVAADRPRTSLGRVEWPRESPPCLLPRAAAPGAGGRSVLVACMGIDQVLELDAAERPLLESTLARWRVPAGPVALAVDAAQGEAWVWSMFDRKLSRIALVAREPHDAGAARNAEQGGITSEVDASIAVREDAKLDADWLRGRALFHTPLGFDGRACASCHPDARTDGLTWSSPNGPLQTPMLAGRLIDEAPYGWLGDSATLEAHIAQARIRLRARPLEAAEVHDLAVYITRARTLLGPRARGPLEERGRLIFGSAKVGCAECHHDGGERGDRMRHDVGTGGSFDTPTLRFAGGTAPYMHDGRYATLRELLVRTDGKMGRTGQLREPDVLALTAYLRSL